MLRVISNTRVDSLVAGGLALVAASLLTSCPANKTAPAPSPPERGQTEPSTDAEPPPSPGDDSAPREVRVPDESTFGQRWEESCDAFAAADPCRLRADFDGDGAQDTATKIVERSSGQAGIAFRWADGSISVVGAGSETQVLELTFDFVDGFDHPPVFEEAVGTPMGPDLEFSSWNVAAGLDGEYLGSREHPRYPVPEARGAGITFNNNWLLLYYDGAGWRVLVMI